MFIRLLLTGVTLLFLVPNSFALTTSDLAGEYALKSFSIRSVTYGVSATQDDMVSFDGKASITHQGFVMQARANDGFDTYAMYRCGFYNFTSQSRIKIDIYGGSVAYVDVSMVNGVLTTKQTGYEYIDGLGYCEVNYVWEKIEKTYSQAEYDAKPTTSGGTVVVVPLF